MNNSTLHLSLTWVKLSNSCVWSIDGTLKGTTTSGQSGPESNYNERVLHIPQSSRTGASSSDDLKSYTGDLWEGGFLTFCSDAVVILC